jgi:hypothetical protein
MTQDFCCPPDNVGDKKAEVRHSLQLPRLSGSRGTGIPSLMQLCKAARAPYDVAHTKYKRLAPVLIYSSFEHNARLGKVFHEIVDQVVVRPSWQ